MSKKLKEKNEAPVVPEEDFLNIFGAIMNNYTHAVSLNDAGDDAMSTGEILEIMWGMNPFRPVSMLVGQMQKLGFKFQFDLRSRELKWLIKYVKSDQ